MPISFRSIILVQKLRYKHNWFVGIKLIVLKGFVISDLLRLFTLNGSTIEFERLKI